jgi:hypothetical protein
MKKVTVSIPDDKVKEFESLIQQLNISILKEDEKLKVEEWQRDIVEKDPNSSEYLSSDEIEKTSFSREKN